MDVILSTQAPSKVTDTPSPGSSNMSSRNKLASLEATLVRNSAHPLTYSLTGVKCRATSVAKNCHLRIMILHRKLVLAKITLYNTLFFPRIILFCLARIAIFFLARIILFFLAKITIFFLARKIPFCLAIMILFTLQG